MSVSVLKKYLHIWFVLQLKFTKWQTSDSVVAGFCFVNGTLTMR